MNKNLQIPVLFQREHRFKQNCDNLSLILHCSSECEQKAIAPVPSASCTPPLPLSALQNPTSSSSIS